MHTDIYGKSFYFLTYTLYSLDSILINNNIGSWFERQNRQFQVIINVIPDSSFMDKSVTWRKDLHGLWSSSRKIRISFMLMGNVTLKVSSWVATGLCRLAAEELPRERKQGEFFGGKSVVICTEIIVLWYPALSPAVTMLLLF